MDLRAACESRLEPGEEVLACFTPDLDPALRFGQSLVLVTNQRLMSIEAHDATADGVVAAGGAAGSGITYRLRSWPLSKDVQLRDKDQGRIGILELLGSGRRLAHWQYTIGRAAEARQFVQRHTLLQGEQDVLEEAERPEAADATAEQGPMRTVSLFRLWRFGRNHIGLILLGFALTMGTTAAGLVPPYLTMPLLDEILIPYQDARKAVEERTAGDLQARAQGLQELQQTQRSRFALVPWYLAGLTGAAVLAWLFSFAQGCVSALVSERIGADLRNSTYNHLLHLSLEFFGDKRTGDLIARIGNDSERICYFLSDTAVDFLTDALTIIGIAAVLTTIDPLMGITTLCTFPVIGWLINWIRSHLSVGFARACRAWDVMTSILADTIPGMRVVKAFAQEEREQQRFRRANNAIYRVNSRVNTVWAFFWPLVAFLNQVGLLVIWGLGAYRVFDHQITVGVLMAFLLYLGRLYIRLESMTRLFNAVQRAATSTHRLFEILDRVPSVRECATPVHPGRLRGGIELTNVNFRYGNRSIIQGLNLTIQPGEMIGIVGSSGAGKTTLVNLLCRFYDVSEGAILVDGVDIRSFFIAEYRRNIGIVLQEPFLFFGTIAENIAYGRPTATRQEIIAAARAARAHEFILQRPLAYDSLVGERGLQLSGGERQRISIARAILIDPRILILDEATSSVDTQTEREIQHALDNLVQGRTTIAIAHRLSTLERADRLIVLERGRIVEMGRHDELLRQGGTYANLYHAQGEEQRCEA